MKTKSFLSCFLFTIAVSSMAIAQNGSISSGGVASGSGGTMSFSIGQIDYNSAGPGGSVSQGNQQPYETVAVSVESIADKDISVFVYPNPSEDHLIVRYEKGNSENLVYQLVDQQGKFLATKKATGTETNFSLSELSNATYFIKIINNNKEIGNFRIIKNK